MPLDARCRPVLHEFGRCRRVCVCLCVCVCVCVCVYNTLNTLTLSLSLSLSLTLSLPSLPRHSSNVAVETPSHVCLPSSSFLCLPASSCLSASFLSLSSPSFQQMRCEEGLKEGVGDSRTGERSGGLEVLEICLAVEEWRRMVSSLPKPTCARKKETQRAVSTSSDTQRMRYTAALHRALAAHKCVKDLAELARHGGGMRAASRPMSLTLCALSALPGPSSSSSRGTRRGRSDTRGSRKASRFSYRPRLPAEAFIGRCVSSASLSSLRTFVFCSALDPGRASSKPALTASAAAAAATFCSFPSALAHAQTVLTIMIQAQTQTRGRHSRAQSHTCPKPRNDGAYPLVRVLEELVPLNLGLPLSFVQLSVACMALSLQCSLFSKFVVPSTSCSRPRGLSLRFALHLRHVRLGVEHDLSSGLNELRI